MGQRQNEVLAVLVEERVGEFPVARASAGGILPQIPEEALRPPRVPAVVEAEAFLLRRLCGSGPLGGAVRDQKHTGAELPHGFCQCAEKIPALEIFAAAIEISPAVISRVIENRRGVNDADAVRVIFLRPEHGVRQQEIFHLRASEMKDCGLAEAPARLIERGPVEGRQRKRILREVRRRPVQNHADSLAVQKIDEPLEVLRGAEAGGRRVVPGRLIAQGFIQRVLHHRQEFHMREVKFSDVGSDPRGELPVAQVPHPSVQIQLVDEERKRAALSRCRRTLFKPFRIVPGEVLRIRHDGRRLGPALRLECVRIRLQKDIPVCGLDLIFIDIPDFHAGDKELKDPRISELTHLVPPAVPVIEISDHGDAHRIRRPDREIHAGDPASLLRVRSHLFVDCGVGSRSKFSEVRLRVIRLREGIRIVQRLLPSVLIRHVKTVGDGFPAAHEAGKEAVFVLHIHPARTAVRKKHLHAGSPGNQCLNPHAALDRMRSQNCMRVLRLRIDQFLHIGPVHEVI